MNTGSVDSYLAEGCGRCDLFQTPRCRLMAVLDADPELRGAFDRLTPGRRRSYCLHVGGAKKPATRASRAERCVPKILSGKGFSER